MKRSDYRNAANLVEQHFRDVLDELTEGVLEIDGNDDPVLGHDIDKLLDSHSHKLWSITSCLQQLRHAARPEPQPAQVTKIDCSHESVTDLLSDWLHSNKDATILSISILDYVDRLTCIMVFQPSC